ncbi:MAG: SagB/ThcOx family dehydrogenase [Ignavibacteria bacterium]|nr:SagB/ThcOx family dehydrogenase [Ignavibacteria bacterium]
MKKTIITTSIAVLVILAAIYFLPFNGETGEKSKVTEHTQSIRLPDPVKTGGMPLMEALQNRKSSRTFSGKKIEMQMLSNLLWAANGVNRNESGKRTAPTANDTRAMDIYVIMEDGAYLFNPDEHSIEQISDKDLREFAGRQDFVKKAPLNLIYVSDYSKLKTGSEKEIYSGSHAGFIGQNVYLFCASAGLNTVVRAWVDKDVLKKEMNLKEDAHIILAQTIGFQE